MALASRVLARPLTVDQVVQVAADGMMVPEVLELLGVITAAVVPSVESGVEVAVEEQEAPVVMVIHLMLEGQEELVFQIQ